MALSVTASDPQAGVISLYKADNAGPVRISKQHHATLAGGRQIHVPPFDAPLGATLDTLVGAATITAAQRTAFVAVLQALNAHMTTVDGL